MRISTRGRYGSRVMLELALNYRKGPVQVREIAKRQELSPKYIEQLIAPLKTSGLVRAVRGMHGGYVLSKSPSRIKLIEIFRVLEGPLALVACVDDPEICSRQQLCVTRDIWEEITGAVTRILSSTTLADMVERQQQKKQEVLPMYYI